MTVLLLAGTREAREIARLLVCEGIDAVGSLAGVTRAPEQLALPMRVGGFGGAAGFVDYVKSSNIRAVLDATHPFAARISRRTAQLCRKLDIPYCQFLRPPWTLEPSWVSLTREEDLAAHVQKGETVFLATGRQTLARFANLSHANVICRQIEPPEGPFPFPSGCFHIARPPFSLDDEKELFQSLKVDWVVAKNAGGAMSRTKLDAASALNLNVALIDRPAQPEGAKAQTVEDCLSWLRKL
ncbi:MAG: cobalt-precorrin-6A reductase [Pseudomonadota bacterium]